MILGIPNVGKSTLINKLARRSAAKTADKPGETKGKQWVHIGDQPTFDTPGVLGPSWKNQVSAYRLAATGAISDTVFDMETVITQLIEELSQFYADELLARFKLDALGAAPLKRSKPSAASVAASYQAASSTWRRLISSFWKEHPEGKIGLISLDRCAKLWGRRIMIDIGQAKDG